VQDVVEAVPQHALGETAWLALQREELLGRTLRDRTRESGQLDFGGGGEAAADRAQRLGEALLLPAIGFPSLIVEKIQCGDESPVKLVQLLGGLLHLFSSFNANTDIGGRVQPDNGESVHLHAMVTEDLVTPCARRARRLQATSRKRKHRAPE